MSSFKRRLPPTATPLPHGCISHPSVPTLPLVSTGIPSLDDILGLGLPLGSLLLVLAPDGHSSWGKLVSRYWVAQGLASEQDIVVLSGEESDARELVEGCMWLDSSVAKARAAEERVDKINEQYRQQVGEEEDSDAEGLVEEVENRTKIAWRYGGMKKVEMGLGKNATRATASGSDFSHALNLTTTLPPAVLASSLSSGQLTYLSVNTPTYATLSSASASSSAYAPLARILAQLQEVLIGKGVLAEEEGGKKENKVVRVLVHELGGLEWGSKISSIHIHRFLHSLRILLRRAPTVAVTLTLPSHLCRSPPNGEVAERREWVERLAKGGDGCVEFVGFASDPSLPPSFPTLHSLLHPHSLPSAHTLLSPAYKHSTLLGFQGPGGREENLGGRVKRKRLVLERVGLGVEGGVGERRTEPKPAGVAGVGGGGGHVHGPECGHEGVDVPPAAGAVVIEVDGLAGMKEGKGDQAEEAGETLQLGGGRKGREKKTVAFQGVRHDRLDLYEF